MINSSKIKPITGVYVVNWGGFDNPTHIRFRGMRTLLYGTNGSGKTTLMDAVKYVLFGIVKFNDAREQSRNGARTVKSYVRGDMKNDGAARYLRKGEIISWLAVEFFDPGINQNFTATVCIESPDEASSTKSYYALFQNTCIDDLNFFVVNEEKRVQTVTLRTELKNKGVPVKRTEFSNQEEGVSRITRAMGLRINSKEDRKHYIHLITQLFACKSIDSPAQFLEQSLLEDKMVTTVPQIREMQAGIKELQEGYRLTGEQRDILLRVKDKKAVYDRNKTVYDTLLLKQAYCEYKNAESSVKGLEKRIRQLESQKKKLEQEVTEATAAEKEAVNQYNQFKKRPEYEGFTSTIELLESEIEEAKEKLEKAYRKTDMLSKLRLNYCKLAKWQEPVFTENEILSPIAEFDRTGIENRQQIFTAFSEAVEECRTSYSIKLAEVTIESKTISDKLAVLSRNIRELENGRMVYPENAITVRNRLQAALDKNGMNVKAKLFAELVTEFRDESWQQAIESYLGNRRFNIILPPECVKEALRIVEEARIANCSIVLTNRLPERIPLEGSASALLEIENKEARAYADYLLGDIILCENRDELMDNPTGGIMKNGLTATGYVARTQDIGKVTLCLGFETVKKRLEAAIEETKKLTEEKRHCEETRQEFQTRFDYLLNHINLSAEDYNFSAPEQAKALKAEGEALEKQKEDYKKNPNYIDFLNQCERLEKKVEKSRDRAVDKQAKLQNAEREKVQLEIQLPEAVERAEQNRLNYEKELAKTPGLESPMLESYSKRPEVTQRQITDRAAELANARNDVEKEMLEYCNKATGSKITRDTALVGYYFLYQQELDKIIKVDIEKIGNQLEAKKHELQTSFYRDFIMGIYEHIREAKVEQDKINNSLKKYQFGTDTFQFQITERKDTDRAQFYRIARLLESMSEVPEDEIEDFMSKVLAEDPDSTEYTDYRHYLSYDVKITNVETGNTGDITKKQGGLSAGEEQTAPYIILAAALNQYYPDGVCCARPIFLDEVFSKMSDNRSLPMMEYFSNFQCFYVKPNMNDIGEYMDTVVAFKKTGDVFYVVEGMGVIKGESA